MQQDRLFVLRGVIVSLTSSLFVEVRNVEAVTQGYERWSFSKAL